MDPLLVISNAAAGTADEESLATALGILRERCSVEVQATVNPGELDSALHRAGSRRIVVDWGALRFWSVTSKSATIGLDLTRDQVKAAPEYKEDQPIIVLGAAGSLHPLRFRPMPKPKEN